MCERRTGLAAAAGLLLGLCGTLGCGDEGGDSAYLMERAVANSNTVNLLTGSYTGTLARMGGEIGSVLDADDLRVVPVVGQGSSQGIRDLLYLDGVDVAMFASFVVEYGRRNNLHPGADLDAIEYIAPLFPQHLHILVRDDIQSVQDLEGRRVNYGPETNIAFIVGTLVMNDLGVQAEVVSEGHSTALSLLQNGEIDGMIRLGGVPQSLFDDLDETSGLHFLTVNPEDLSSRVFQGGTLTPESYPGLIDAGTEVPTLTTRSILAVYNPTGVHPRADRIDLFVTRLFENFATFQDPDKYEDAWLEVDLAQEVPGMRRYGAAAQLVAP